MLSTYIENIMYYDKNTVILNNFLSKQVGNNQLLAEMLEE